MRIRLEPLIEVTQIKGDGETDPMLAARPGVAARRRHHHGLHSERTAAFWS